MNYVLFRRDSHCAEPVFHWGVLFGEVAEVFDKMSTVGKIITCKAAVCQKYGEPLVIEEIQVAPPKSGEVRIKVISCGVCHSDCNYASGSLGDISGQLPIILGHEVSGVVESCGEGVTEVQEGDHVILTAIAQCRNCKVCNGTGNFNCRNAKEVNVPSKGNLLDGSTRFSSGGTDLHHFMGVSGYTEYTVSPKFMVTKVPHELPLEKVCIFGCCIMTGYFSAVHKAAVTSGSTCAVFGLGGIGLAAVMGCRNNGANRIIAVDTNPDKFPIAKSLGATDYLNPNEYDRPIEDVIVEMTDGGCEFTFECVGSRKVIESAFRSSDPSVGVTMIVGVPPQDDNKIEICTMDMLGGRVLMSAILGGYKVHDGIKRLSQEYVAGIIDIDPFITGHMPLEKINDAFKRLVEGKCIRTVIDIGRY
ncbi:alcohol dehydrogenase 1-like [Tubulanus polymorphus]|uniref:alcohol dehydrogenase 1-like n=1 Tax=Tubulanus polymorphus TaxID=672921 RepID=UPI003DA4C8D7